MGDAKFEDGAPEGALKLSATTNEDLGVVSTLVQDAIAQTSDMSWLRKKRQFVLLLNRFRWEDKDAAMSAGRPFERVQSMLLIRSVINVKAQGVDPKDKSLVLDLLGLQLEAAEDLSGDLNLTFAGDGMLSLDVECLDVELQDVSRPYVARSQKVPRHPEAFN